MGVLDQRFELEIAHPSFLTPETVQQLKRSFKRTCLRQFRAIGYAMRADELRVVTVAGSELATKICPLRPNILTEEDQVWLMEQMAPAFRRFDEENASVINEVRARVGEPPHDGEPKLAWEDPPRQDPYVRIPC